MITKTTQFYTFYFYDTYVVVEAFENINFDIKAAENTLSIIFDHFEGRDFTIISHRKNKYNINLEAYSNKLFKKVKAIAVVSECPDVKEKAQHEQMKFGQSFAYFNNLDDARSWAESVVPV
ncbi:hypothetical protein L1I30_07550 [Gillisia sp. M10.2A]|uniref:SpoIIAA-like n=1 Tax=Gillisia lutea TaxID=2909668 RepID=A0ABS9EF70_9FLAO|nr:hypothetical protein [Gillisia lutea]MCF4101515.1 hypothetical protein [Gillisia lutea]